MTFRKAQQLAFKAHQLLVMRVELLDKLLNPSVVEVYVLHLPHQLAAQGVVLLLNARR